MLLLLSQPFMKSIPFYFMIILIQTDLAIKSMLVKNHECSKKNKYLCYFFFYLNQPNFYGLRKIIFWYHLIHN